MTDEKNQAEKTQTRVELQIIPFAKNLASEKQGTRMQNHEHLEEAPCAGKIILNITCDGSKLTKADAGYNVETSTEIWVTAKVLKAEEGKVPDIDVSVHEKCGSKLTKADSGRTA